MFNVTLLARPTSRRVLARSVARRVPPVLVTFEVGGELLDTTLSTRL